MKVLVLGAGGMLGHQIIKELKHFDVIAPTRDEYNAPDSIERFGLRPGDSVINCIGVIPQKNQDADIQQKINGDYPNLLATHKELYFIQIATDCVFNGKTGPYDESSPKNAEDSYGKSKISGEVFAKNWLNLRCSIIGPELTGKRSLFEWVKNQPKNAVINGYINHYWNGVTTQAFARVISGILSSDFGIAGTQHLVPLDYVSKYELIQMFINKLGRTDIELIPTITEKIDRRLSTKFDNVNRLLWRGARYIRPPRIIEMVGTMEVE